MKMSMAAVRQLGVAVTADQNPQKGLAVAAPVQKVLPPLKMIGKFQQIRKRDDVLLAVEMIGTFQQRHLEKELLVLVQGILGKDRGMKKRNTGDLVPAVGMLQGLTTKKVDLLGDVVLPRRPLRLGIRLM
jgi:hypothetical protein